MTKFYVPLKIKKTTYNCLTLGLSIELPISCTGPKKKFFIKHYTLSYPIYKK